jgi:hypothetical protein
MDQAALQALFLPLYSEFINLVSLNNPARPLHLAHYTSLEVLEKIIINNEIWFSNPLFMNDHQEMRFGMTEGVRVLSLLQQDNDLMFQIGGQDKFSDVMNAFQNALNSFEINHSFNLYIFCLSEYNFEKPDGSLSMWRGYGANGQGAALVFNTNFITPVEKSPLFFGKVEYLSVKERAIALNNIYRKCLDFLNKLPDKQEFRQYVGVQIFRLSLIHALTTKHHGFEEEYEWRIIYFPDFDVLNLMKDCFCYVRKGNCIEPKLKFPIEPLQIEPRQTWSFDTIVDRIVLGPTHYSYLALNSAKRMLQNLGKPNFAEKIWVSEIPYRPIG